jgi:hypothetical protein
MLHDRVTARIKTKMTRQQVALAREGCLLRCDLGERDDLRRTDLGLVEATFVHRCFFRRMCIEVTSPARR